LHFDPPQLANIPDPMPLEIGSADSDKDAKLTVNGGIFMTILGRRSVLSLVIDWFKVIRQ
jgi:hypothetical protein